jgi:hypothetical protein
MVKRSRRQFQQKYEMVRGNIKTTSGTKFSRLGSHDPFPLKDANCLVGMAG